MNFATAKFIVPITRARSSMAEQTTYTRPVVGSSPAGPTVMSEQNIKNFQQAIWDFYKTNRRDFPWRETTDPYKILVSEIMLQQTQTDRVIRYYEKWLKRFPDFKTLAAATFSEIYPYWQGLGYNRRGLNLQKVAQKAVLEYRGTLPKEVDLLEEFPGIGPYTARAVSIFSFNTPVACIETNIRRVFIHHFFPESRNHAEINVQTRARPALPDRPSPELRGKKIDDEEILKIAERALPAGKAREWHWALMDYGTHLKSQVPNPNRRHKNYRIQPKFEGSLRQIRGAALRILSGESANLKNLTARIQKATEQDTERIKKVIETLEKERLIKQDNNIYSLN